MVELVTLLKGKIITKKEDRDRHKDKDIYKNSIENQILILDGVKDYYDCILNVKIDKVNILEIIEVNDVYFLTDYRNQVYNIVEEIIKDER